MDLACAYRLSHPRLRPHNRVDARFGWLAVPASDRRCLDRDGLVRSADHHDSVQTPRTVGLVRLVVLPGVLDCAPRGRIAARKRARPPGSVHRSLACGSAPARARVLPAEGGTGNHDLLKIPFAANFLEGVMNFSSGTVACGHGYSKSVPKRCVRRRVGVRGSLPRARPRGRPTTRVRSARGPQRTEVVVRTGSPWRYMPHDLPPWEAIYQQTQRWIRAGVFEEMV